MDWLASQDGFEAAVAVDNAQMRLQAAVETRELMEVRLNATKQRNDELVAIASRPPPLFNPRGVIHLLTLIRVSAANARSAANQREQQRRHEDELREAFKNVWLRATCDQLYHTLPRELRDMIYQDLLSASDLETWSPEQCSTDPGGVAWRLHNSDHGPDWYCYDKNAIGTEVFRELLQNFFHCACFGPFFGTQIDLPDFLSRDKFDVGIPPIACLQRVNMDIREIDFENRTLLRNLDGLRLLKRDARLNVKLVPLRKYQLKEHGYEGMTMPSIPKTGFFCRTDKDMLTFFERLRPTFEVLKSIVETERVSLEVFLNRYGCHTSLHKSTPGEAVDISLEAWKQFVMKKRG